MSVALFKKEKVFLAFGHFVTEVSIFFSSLYLIPRFTYREMERTREEKKNSSPKVN